MVAENCSGGGGGLQLTVKRRTKWRAGKNWGGGGHTNGGFIVQLIAVGSHLTEFGQQPSAVGG